MEIPRIRSIKNNFFSQTDVSEVTKLIDSCKSSRQSPLFDNVDKGKKMPKPIIKISNLKADAASEKLTANNSTNMSLVDNHIKVRQNTTTNENKSPTTDENKSPLSTTFFNQAARSEQISSSNSERHLGYKPQRKIIRSIKQIKVNQNLTAQGHLNSHSLTLNDIDTRKVLSKDKLNNLSPNSSSEKKITPPGRPNNTKLIDTLIERKKKYDLLLNDQMIKMQQKKLSAVDYNKKYYYLKDEANIKKRKELASKAIIDIKNLPQKSHKSSILKRYNFKEYFSYVVANGDQSQALNSSDRRKKAPSIEKYESPLKGNYSYK